MVVGPAIGGSGWFTEYVKVEGKHVIIKLNDKTVVDYTEPSDFKPPPGQTNHFLSNGTFALQGHDPKSEVHFKNIMVKVLDQDFLPIPVMVEDTSYDVE